MFKKIEPIINILPLQDVPKPNMSYQCIMYDQNILGISLEVSDIAAIDMAIATLESIRKKTTTVDIKPIIVKSEEKPIKKPGELLWVVLPGMCIRGTKCSWYTEPAKIIDAWDYPETKHRKYIIGHENSNYEVSDMFISMPAADVYFTPEEAEAEVQRRMKEVVI